MDKKEQLFFASFLVRIKKKGGGKWFCSVSYIQGGERLTTNNVDKIPEIIKKFLGKGEAKK